jgi:hypothetical protein
MIENPEGKTVILFTGHRDRHLDPAQLEMIAGLYEGAIWLHGGAIGFDTQVENFAKANGIETRVVTPNYKLYGSKQAPLVRDCQMVEMADLVVACYDGRRNGGTAYTLRYARSEGKKVRVFQPVPVTETKG